MHPSNYQPTRSQQLDLVEHIKRQYGFEREQIVVHHVLEDTPTRLYLQIERRRFVTTGNAEIIFQRVSL